MPTSNPLPRSLNAWLKELDGVRLPVCSEHHTQAIRTIRDNRSSLRDIAERLQESPALALAVMRAANNTKNSLSDPAANLEVALSRLGLQSAEQLIKQLPAVPVDSIPLALRQLQLISLHAAQQANGLFGARLARLWHDIQCSSLLFLAPLWPLVVKYPQLFAAWEDRVLRKGDAPSRVEKELLGVPLLSLCLALAEKWRLPEWILHGYRLLLSDRRQMVKAIRVARLQDLTTQRQHLDDDSALRRWLTLPDNCILLANGLAVSAHAAWNSHQTLGWESITALYLQLSLAELQQLVHQQAVNSARQQSQPGLWHPAQALIWPWSARHWQTAPTAAPAPAKSDLDQWRQHCSELLRDPSPFANVVQLTSTAREALQACGIQRLLLLLADRTHSRLIAQQSLGLAKEANTLSLDPNQSQILRQLLTKPAQLRLTPENFAQYSALLPGSLKALLPSQHLIFRSIANQQRVAMLLVIDQGGVALSETRLQAFTKTVQCIERALASFAKRAR